MTWYRAEKQEDCISHWFACDTCGKLSNVRNDIRTGKVLGKTGEFFKPPEYSPSTVGATNKINRPRRVADVR
jgi:hypothetical protein